MGEIPFPEEFRIGNVYSMVVFDLDYEDLEYGYRFDGPDNFAEGHWFDKSKILLDPYAKIIGGRDVWGITPDGMISINTEPELPSMILIGKTIAL